MFIGPELIPVTIITGFLGSDKTTLLKRILQGKHGLRIAVIENEFALDGIDNALLVQDSEEQIVEMNNGCICCSVRGDLIRIFGELHAKRQAGTLAFDHVIIETTGLAAPGPVAQTFFAELPCRAVFQGVHMLVGSELGAPWRDGETRASKMVFIGRGLPQETLIRGLDGCVAGAGPAFSTTYSADTVP